MADEKVRKPRAKSPNPLAGSQIKSTVLDKTVKADVDLSKQLVDEVLGGSNIDYAALEKFTTISNGREQVYELIDTMGRDSAVAMLLKTFAGSVCEAADNGHIIWCEAKDPKVSKYVNYLLNIMNVDKYIYGWTYCLLKYGDVYLKLFRESDYEDDLFGQPKTKGARDILNEELDKETARVQGLDENIILSMHNNNDKYSYYVEMVADPSTMFELTKYGKTYGFIEVPNTKNVGYDYSEVASAASGITMANYRMKSNDIIVHQADDYVHAYLDDNYTRFPETVQIYRNNTDYDADLNSMDYTVKRGKSILYDSYKTWREKTLLENAAILNRVTRSSIIRLVGIDVGDMSKEKAKATLRYVKSMIEQKTAMVVGSTTAGMSEYVNPGPTENNVYYTKHNGQGEITINAVGGDTEVKGIADLEWWNDKFYAAFGVPKQYFGFTDEGGGFNGGSALTIISAQFGKNVKMVQNAMVQAVTEAINLMLINNGLVSYLNNFVLKMQTPITQEMLDYRKDLTDRLNAISSMNALFTDVEDRERRLKLLKYQLGTLNYGDEMQAIIDEEIEAIKAAKEEEKNNPPEGEEAGGAPVAPNAPKEEPAGGPDDIELPPIPTNESLQLDGLEKKLDLLENSDEDLPNPEDIKGIDFTANN